MEYEAYVFVIGIVNVKMALITSFDISRNIFYLLDDIAIRYDISKSTHLGIYSLLKDYEYIYLGLGIDKENNIKYYAGSNIEPNYLDLVEQCREDLKNKYEL